MEGFKHQSKYYTKKALVDSLVLKGLPYGKWTTEDNKEYLFNRDYEPFLGWDLTMKAPIPIKQSSWVRDIVKEEFYYKGGSYPTKSEKTLRRCWDILADWTERTMIKEDSSKSTKVFYGELKQGERNGL